MIEENEHIEQVETPETDAAPVEAPPVERKTLSLRETIKEAVDKTADKTDARTEKPAKPAKVRDTEGKFAKTEAQQRPVSADAPPVDAPNPPQTKEKSVPTAYAGKNSIVAAKWNELPPEIRAEIAKREEDAHRKLTGQDQDRDFGKRMNAAVAPFMDEIKASGAQSVEQAIGSLLNTAAVLRRGSPELKAKAIGNLIAQYGVDPRLIGNAQTQNVDPQVRALQERLNQLEFQNKQDTFSKRQTEERALHQQIEEFKADPAHSHFETVKAHMGALLERGLAKTLQDAYDQAVMAHPQTRSILAQETAGKRLAEQKAVADKARIAGSSVKGAPGASASRDPKVNGLDLRSTIRAAVRQHAGNLGA